MTNREWLLTLPTSQLVELVGHSTICYHIQDTDKKFCQGRETCEGCIEAWLDAEHTEEISK